MIKLKIIKKKVKAALENLDIPGCIETGNKGGNMTK